MHSRNTLPRHGDPPESLGAAAELGYSYGYHKVCAYPVQTKVSGCNRFLGEVSMVRLKEERTHHFFHKNQENTKFLCF